MDFYQVKNDYKPKINPLEISGFFHILIRFYFGSKFPV